MASAVKTRTPRQFFLDRVRQLEGVLHADAVGGMRLAEQSFVVYIRPGDVESERRIYRLKGEVYDRYPDARLDVWIEEQENPED